MLISFQKFLYWARCCKECSFVLFIFLFFSDHNIYLDDALFFFEFLLDKNSLLSSLIPSARFIFLDSLSKAHLPWFPQQGSPSVIASSARFTLRFPTPIFLDCLLSRVHLGVATHRFADWSSRRHGVYECCQGHPSSPLCTVELPSCYDGGSKSNSASLTQLSKFKNGQ